MTSITIISGSTLGNAESVAEHLSEILTRRGFITSVYHGPKLSDLPQSGIWLIISSTHGAGDIPDNLIAFSEQLTEPSLTLKELCYGAIGLGDRHYDQFCGAIRKLDQQLTSKKALRCSDRLEIDVSLHADPEMIAEAWLDIWLQSLP